MNRYQVLGREGEFQPESGGLVLANMQDITDPDEMNTAELYLYEQLYTEVLAVALPRRSLTAADICDWHRRWLGQIYPWAGQLRSVNMSKDGFPFAAASQLQRLLANFEARQLCRLTPCMGLAIGQLIAAIAEVHVELILIHPFREGNGRLARLVADVMAVQAGLGPLDYSSWKQGNGGYIGAIHAGVVGDYRPMMALVAKALGTDPALVITPG